MKISKKTKLSKLIEINPDASKILFEAGMHCLGCAMASEETLEQGCKTHGIDKKDIDKLVIKLNKKK